MNFQALSDCMQKKVIENQDLPVVESYLQWESEKGNWAEFLHSLVVSANKRDSIRC